MVVPWPGQRHAALPASSGLAGSFVYGPRSDAARATPSAYVHGGRQQCPPA